MTSPQQAKHILVVFSKFDLTHRQMLGGILKYAHENCSSTWRTQLELRDISRRSLAELKSGGFDGIIAAVINPADRRKYFATGLPVVLYEPTLAKWDHSRRPAQSITFFNDHMAEGRTAADYFIKRRYRSFAYVGTAKPTFWSDERINGFSERLRDEGYTPLIYPSPPPREQNDFALESQRLTKWLRRLPRQTALFCVHDRRAQQVIATAVDAGLRIPEDIAVLGVDNDELLCEMTVPAISSIPVNDHERGRAVGEAMDCLLERRPVKRVHITRHDMVITRTSTDAQAIADPFVARAIAYARANIPERPSLPELAKVAGCSKTILNLHARHALGHTITDEITRLQLNDAIEQLTSTNRTIDEIAINCGFCSASHLAMRLKASTGKSPKHYRSAANAGQRHLRRWKSGAAIS